jgi:hypothetical protein
MRHSFGFEVFIAAGFNRATVDVMPTVARSRNEWPLSGPTFGRLSD